ncbi:hypothetical protein LJR009_001594 [Bosea sp. LjRoot9]|uniref:hypothetical protein n=1 Tax=Bosea sp. LjRoot9 TaxID=3342341 RepID=UPI003ED019CE
MSSAPAPRREDQPDGSVRICFAAPILHFAEPKGSLLLRQPTVFDVLDIGDPVSWIYDAANNSTRVVERDKLKIWFARLIDGHDPDVIGRERDTALGVLIEDALLGFFPRARTRLKPVSAP